MINRINTHILPCVRRLASLLIISSLFLSLCSCSKNNNDFDGFRFGQTRHITVLVDSKTNSATDCTVDSSKAAQYIREAVLRDCNIEVHYMESSKLNFQYGVSADISYVNDTNALNTYYRMNSIVNIAPYLNQYSNELSDLTGLLGDEYLYSCTNEHSEVWYLSPRDYEPDSIVTFIRLDWLDKLGLDVPHSREEFLSCLLAFRDNADLLLGEESAKMVPFFIDNDPAISAKPLFDSCLDTSIDDKDFFVNGYCRVTQDGYKDGLETLNDWYLQGLLPEDYTNIRPQTKESYDPIEKGYVGAFCAKYDYLYANGDNSHINSFHELCGEDAEYIAVNTFENSEGEYTFWQEDYICENDYKIFLPSTCSDPLACLVYLNWLSKSENISEIMNIVPEDDDPFIGERYLLTCQGLSADDDLVDIQNAEIAKQTALDVICVQRGNKCVRYNEGIFKYVNSEIDLEHSYPDSTRLFICSVINADDGEFDSVYSSEFEKYYGLGAEWIVKVRDNEWENVMVRGVTLPR